MPNPSSLLPCRHAVVLLLALATVCACKRTQTEHAAQAASAPAPDRTVQADPAPAQVGVSAVGADDARGLPADFKEYAASAFDSDRLCVVGAVSTADAPAQQAYVAVKRADDGSVLWSQALSGIEGMYQTRATHCVYANGALHVLLQSDTHPQQSLSQTQLSVARVAANGGAPSAAYVAVPGTRDRAYSAWVDPGAANFSAQAGQLHVRGHYRFTDDPGVQHDFEVALGVD